MLSLRNRFFPILIVLAIVPLIPLFHAGLPLTHDGQDHVARIANFYQDLSQGILVPRWAPNLNWGYGHPILMFLYPLPSYIASFFHFVGFSLVDSVKLVFGLSYIVSGITMFWWAREEFGDWPGFAAAALYLFAPYRFVELYVRGDIGEHMAFIFMPLVLYFLRRLSEKSGYWLHVGGILSLAGLILAHNAITVMFLPLLLLYTLYLWGNAKERKRFLTASISLLILGFCAAAFFVFPAFFEGKYTLRDIVTQHGEYLAGFSSIWRFFYSTWSFGGTGALSVMFGTVQWLVIAVSGGVLVVMKKKKPQYLVFSLGCLMVLLGCIFLMIYPSNFVWQHISLLQKFQFPWRFLAIVVLVVPALAGITLLQLSPKAKQWGSIALVILTMLSTVGYWKVRGYLTKPESFYTGVYKGTTDTGESAPVWSVRFMEHTPKSPIELLSGNATVKPEQRIATRHTYAVTATDAVRMRENTLYFPGWHVLIDGKEVPVEYQDPANRGLMTFFVPSGSHQLEIRFTETRLRLLSDIVSLITLLSLCIWGILHRRLWRTSR